MNIKYLIVTILMLTCTSSVYANDVSFNLNDLKQRQIEIKSSISKNLLEMATVHNLESLNTKDAEKLASDFVDRLYLFFTSTGEEFDIKELEYLTKTLKTDIIKLSTQKEENIKLLETFIESYHKRSVLYPAMQTPLDLFLSEITSGEDLINTIKLLNVTSDENLIRQIVEINLNSVTWKEFINSNSKDLLLSFMKGNRPMLSKFSRLIENSLNPSISATDRQILTRISIINDIAKIVEQDYTDNKQTARYSYHGNRVTIRAEILQKHFGILKKEDAQFLNEILNKTNPSSLGKTFPDAKGWIQGLTKWTRQSLNSKGNVALSIGALVAITTVSELIRNYTKPSDYYLSEIDEINDSLEIENYITLAHRSIYDNKFANILDIVLEENSDEEQQLAYAESLILFNRAIFDVFFQETNQKINKQIYNCFTYGTDCGKA